MTTTADRPAEYKVVGSRPIRHDGVDKVTGKAKYGGDYTAPDLLHGKIVRSPHAHARIKRIDSSKAEALDGVRAIVTHADLSVEDVKESDLRKTLGNIPVAAENVLANKKALYKGHAIAAVAASSLHIAEQAVDLIEVEYEVLPAVLDVRAAMASGAAILHEQLSEKDESLPDAGQLTNVAGRLHFGRGDLARGFEEADVIVDRELDTQPVHQGYIELHNSTANWNADDRVTVWTSTQGAFAVRTQTAAMIGLPESSVKVVPMEIGGGFGGKINSYFDPVAALLSKKTGHPVKFVMNRREVFEATGPTSGSHLRCKIGAKKDGTITAIELYMAFEAGAYPGSPVGAGCMCAIAPYNVENFAVDGLDVVVNKPKVAAYRAPGAPQGAYAVETVIDELAGKLGMDPMELRLKNVSEEGDRQVTGVPFPKIGASTVERAMKAHPHYSAPKGPNQGRGAAMGFWFNAGMQSSASISVNTDGAVNLVTGSVDIGGTRAALAMQAAEVLGLTAEDVHPSVADTDSIGYTGVTGGSRTAFSTGIAVVSAAEMIKAEMIARAAKMWETQPEDIDYVDGVFISKKDPADRLTFKEVAAKMNNTGGPIVASASSNPTQVGPSFAGLLVDVTVDPETGKVGLRPRHRVPGRGAGGAPQLRRGPDAGRDRPGSGLGVERGVLLRRRRRDGEFELPRLPHAHQPRSAGSRGRLRQRAKPRAPLRPAGRRRGLHRAADGRRGQRHQRRHRSPPHRPADEPRSGAPGAGGRAGGLARPAFTRLAARALSQSLPEGDLCVTRRAGFSKVARPRRWRRPPPSPQPSPSGRGGKTPRLLPFPRPAGGVLPLDGVLQISPEGERFEVYSPQRLKVLGGGRWLAHVPGAARPEAFAPDEHLQQGDDRRAGEEAADVGPVGHARRYRIVEGEEAVEELEHDPESDEGRRGQRHGEDEDGGHDCPDAVVGIEQQVGAHDSRDGAAGPDGRRERLHVGRDLRPARG